MSSFFNEKLRGVKEDIYELSWHTSTGIKQKERKAFKKNHFMMTQCSISGMGLFFFFEVDKRNKESALL